MPSEYEKESRRIIQDALQDPIVRIPRSLKPEYYRYQKTLNLKYLLQVNLFAQLAYASYTLSDIVVLEDIRSQVIISKLSYTILMVLITVWMYHNSHRLRLFDLLLPTSIIGASAIWFFNLNQSASPHTLVYQYASLVFIVLANLCVQVHFRPAIITSTLISLTIYTGVYFNTAGDFSQLFLFSVIYLPVLAFSIYISWSSTLKSRLVFLQHLLNEYNRKAFEHLAHTDALTGLHNRRYFEFLARQHVLDYQASSPTSLLVFDVDYFKRINDRYGHDVGDRVLQVIADTARKQMRQHDVLARYGGEEFVALLPNTKLADAVHIAERLRVKIGLAVLNLKNQEKIEFTISIGATEVDAKEDDFHVLFKQADIALYQAKAKGRNRTETCTGLSSAQLAI